MFLYQSVKAGVKDPASEMRAMIQLQVPCVSGRGPPEFMAQVEFVFVPAWVQKGLDLWVLKSWLQQAMPGIRTMQGIPAMCCTITLKSYFHGQKMEPNFNSPITSVPPSFHRELASRWCTINVSLTTFYIFNEKVLEIVFPTIKTA